AWTRDIEMKAVTARINSALKMIQDGYDPASGIPNWLAEEFVDDWIKVLQNGGRPQGVRNRSGWYVRCTPTRSRYTEERYAPTVDTARAKEAPAPETPKKLRFKIVPFADLRPGPEPLYLVDELIPAAGLVDVWGKAKCFKSFWTLDLMLHVVMGWEYRDRAV